MQDFTFGPEATTGELVVSTPGHYALGLRETSRFDLHGPIAVPFRTSPAFGPVTLAIPIPGGPAGQDRREGYIFTADDVAYFMLGNDGVTFVPGVGRDASSLVAAIRADLAAWEANP